ncbi:ATP-dependent RecD-like DNA helicase [Peptostreptococcus canis]|uniref:ATP-dependent RecD2 DNA helicase n=1 Tax=Peptostreptococcus canis TaxID=1159213 RepID=A0ABR6TIM8_9FIRM|nr:ATP-dependent RecD-like DNA helicase [Peptostreptococcus canis]MBC2575093.1 ATP-dependent RecD-like DNA helicase [Peptostreptococcus canis]MBP1997733.1 exodeoxyribonuclease V alpha subunit [Peptostreptococcus canis]
MEKFEGTVVDIIFSNDSNGYTVARLKTEDYNEIITGIMPGIASGENIEVFGEWNIHENYGRQFQVKEYRVVVPSTISGILAFLSSGVITGVGEKMAKKIVDKFGIRTLEVIQNSPQELLSIGGIGPKKLAPIIESYNENMGVKNIIVSLSPYGISPKLSMKIYRKYGSKSLEIIESNPYRLIEDIVGIGFKIADDIASKTGIEKNSKYRIEQGIMHILKEAINDGHTFLPEDKLLDTSIELLGVPEDLIEEHIYNLAIERKIVVEKYGDYHIIYLAKYHKAEIDVCNNLISLAYENHRDLKIDINEEIEAFEERENIYLANAQKQAVRAAFENGVMVLTGGPGTGKTTTINAIIKLFRINGQKVVLAAPTGRAAKRMTETTGKKAKTIHRLLEMAFDVDDRLIFTKNEDEPVDADVIIIDEASMIDIFLMDNLLKAMSNKTRLILVGDADQLPSVGAGNVLGDIISSGAITVISLTEIFRQAQKSDIIMNAHRINQGEDIKANSKGTDFYFINRDNESGILEEIKSLVGGRLSSFYKCDSLKDIQVLSPMRKGIVGVTNMNIELQKILNPVRNEWLEVELMKRVFRVGDKVMQIKNNYSRPWEDEKSIENGEGIYNGDIGYIYHIDKQNKLIYIVFDEYKIFKYKYDELDEIEHCFCTTVHKSQGSEFPVVIIPMTWGPPMLLSRNLIYTAVTRAKKLVIIVGMKKYLDRMIENDINNDRYSNLGYKLSTFRINNIVE